MSTGTPILGGLTTTQAILGCAGMSAGDISDQRLMATQIEDELELKLYKKLPNWLELYDAGMDDFAPAPARMITKALKNYAKYLGAITLAAKWLGFKKMSSDGKVRNDRFDRMDLEKMQTNLEAQAAEAWALLAELIDPDVYANRPAPTFFGVSSPITDPVTDMDEGV